MEVRERKVSVREVFVDNAVVVEVVDGIEDGVDDSDGVVQNLNPS